MKLAINEHQNRQQSEIAQSTDEEFFSRGQHCAGRFQTAVNDAQGDLDKRVQKAHDLEAQATTARQRWEDSQRGLRAEGSGNDIGTGSGK